MIIHTFYRHNVLFVPKYYKYNYSDMITAIYIFNAFTIVIIQSIIVTKQIISSDQFIHSKMMLIVFVFKITRDMKCAILQTVTIRNKKVHDINGDMFLAIACQSVK